MKVIVVQNTVTGEVKPYSSVDVLLSWYPKINKNKLNEYLSRKKTAFENGDLKIYRADANKVIMATFPVDLGGLEFEETLTVVKEKAKTKKK
jgi:hypothetical protein